MDGVDNDMDKLYSNIKILDNMRWLFIVEENFLFEGTEIQSARNHTTFQ